MDRALLVRIVNGLENALRRKYLVNDRVNCSEPHREYCKCQINKFRKSLTLSLKVSVLIKIFLILNIPLVIRSPVVAAVEQADRVLLACEVTLVHVAKRWGLGSLLTAVGSFLGHDFLRGILFRRRTALLRLYRHRCLLLLSEVNQIILSEAVPRRAELA